MLSDSLRNCTFLVKNKSTLSDSVASTRVQGWEDEPCEPTVRLPDRSELVVSYSRMKSAWGWANGGQPILVCYIRKYVIILGGDIPVDVPSNQNIGEMCPRHPRRGWRQCSDSLKIFCHMYCQQFLFISENSQIAYTECFVDLLDLSPKYILTHWKRASLFKYCLWYVIIDQHGWVINLLSKLPMYLVVVIAIVLLHDK